MSDLALIAAVIYVVSLVATASIAHARGRNRSDEDWHRLIEELSDVRRLDIRVSGAELSVGMDVEPGDLEPVEQSNGEGRTH